MKRLRIALCAIALAAGTTLNAQDTKASNAPMLIPKPEKMEIKEGLLKLSAPLKISYSGEELKGVASLLGEKLRQGGLESKLETGASAPSGVTLVLKPGEKSLGEEGYTLRISKDGVLIQAATKAGIFYGTQTLRQAMIADADKKSFSFPCLEISDKPRFQWRSLMLDVSRMFLPKESMKHYIDAMAYYKMNVLHWHLTDDQGWRIEVKKYPKLTEIGAWRGDKDAPYGGFYTQEDIKEIVAYAETRNVMIVPEIDMPGHSTATLAAYPELSCSGGPFTIPTKGGIFDNLLCAGNDKTFEFIEDVLSEIVPLFPAPYFHVGGDECGKACWKKCAKCQERIKSEGLKNETALQFYFTARLAKMLEAKKRKLIGWDEILESPTLANNAIVQVWRNGLPGQPKYEKTTEEALSRGHSVIMSPWNSTYLCYPYSLISVKKAYLFEPVPANTPSEQAAKIMGLDACVWSDMIFSAPKDQIQDYFDHYIFPRLCAHAETAWSSKEQRSWDDFRKRLPSHLKQFATMGVKFGLLMEDLDSCLYQPLGIWDLNSGAKSAELDVTEMISGPGTYEIKVQHLGGKNAVDIQSVALFENGKEILRDAHPGSSGFFSTANSYFFCIAKPQAAVKYSISVSLSGKGGDNCNGEILAIKLPPLVIAGRWKPSDISAGPTELSFDASSLIKSAGKYRVLMNYTGGNHGLKTKSVALFEDDKEVARDTHAGSSGCGHENHIYHFNLEKYKDGAKYSIKAKVEGAGGKDSNGIVWLGAE